MELYGNPKIKLLELYKLLKSYSDDEHPLSANDLCRMLAEKGIAASRRTVYRDLKVLTEYGADILYTRLPKQGFFLAKRHFELPEVRILLDAVLAAPFITNKKTAELTEKLCGLLNCYQAAEVSSQIRIGKCDKFGNEEIYYNIDTINHAISSLKKNIILLSS
ncbi:HTH domain-containing protein [Caproiciproducens galactitolivorans]|uniref:Uncharacterized protein n=1 Tax=Caproiciproducens galactitolivorans TaxID=642589 RepID=A0A4Z0YFZ1_9FIRM|nr:HTH domain-containing protein [Caproiciproducens galactitolivorans]QEY34006.1 HTH domain-containing protein [Caproiciproducens galactitolivorans]TGJ76586.1 hypothetical protein CAGA_15030 [Caproiciproducens galactitolivorans]